GRPEAPVWELDVLGPAERRQLLERSTTAADYLSDEYIYELVAEAGLDAGGEPIERLLSSVRAYVLDRWLGPAPVGVFGELYSGGVGLQGNAGGPAVMAASFIPDPFGSGDRLYRTGDLARWRADGVLEAVERSGQAVAEDDRAARGYEAPRTLV